MIDLHFKDDDQCEMLCIKFLVINGFLKIEVHMYNYVRKNVTFPSRSWKTTSIWFRSYQCVYSL